IEYLSQYFKITLFYYNPNIAPNEEYRHRVAEIKRFVAEFKTPNKIPSFRTGFGISLLTGRTKMRC
ncbi:MAG: epoxyqueuosine reductase QueH, partial [Actinomycetaceae bacterium]|nr:epoxyqueuosine reductase QueH [Actinomycetaceae bacterium]